MFIVRPDLEREEIAELEPRGLLETLKDPIGRTREPQINVPRGPGAVDPKLQNQPTLQRRAVAQHPGDPRQEAVENQELPLAREVGTRLRSRA